MMNGSPCQCSGAAGGSALSGLCAACLLDAAGVAGAAPERTFDAGSTIGPYEVLTTLGRGGMGHVYLGWDARLCRTVAIKVLAPPFAADAERARRLEREARIVAGISHARICAVYDLGLDDDLTYVVMEHVEGETLADRLARGPLPLDTVLTIAAQIADGLDCAHRHGVTHRDLKPANIMLTAGGAKLLDFGLASRAAPALGAAPASGSGRASSIGGTVHYMAPEQREGRRADVRSDVFAFGLVIREMLTGDPSGGADPQPPVAPGIPPALDRVVRRCLRADPEDRWQSIRDVLFELTTIVEERALPERPAAAPPAAAVRRTRAAAWATAIALTLGIGSAIVAPAVADRRADPGHAMRFTATPPRASSDVMGAGGMAFVSPDGRSLVWVVSSSDNKTSLAVQPFDAAEPTPLAGTEGASWPFWSPDSRAIAFFSRTELRKVPATGGPVETLAKAPSGAGGSWGADGTILFAPTRTGPLSAISDRGGTARVVSTLDAGRGETAHQWPVFLPDGRHFLYFAASRSADRRGLVLASLDSPDRQWLGASDGAAAFAPPRHVLYSRGGMLVAQPFDPRRLQWDGAPSVVQSRVCGSGSVVPPCFSASATGVLVYHVARLFRHQLAWFTRTGRQLDVAIEPASYYSPTMSADGARVALERHDPATWQLGVWLFDFKRRLLTRLLDESAVATGPVWSPDGRTVAYATNTNERHDVFLVPAQGGTPRKLFSAPALVLLTDWSSDGRRLLYQMVGDGTREDLWTTAIDAASPAPFAATRAGERQARFSPDARYVAYSSDESGRPEIYVQPFPPTGAKWRLSNDGGHQPTWRHDGRELYYLSGDRRLIAVPVRLAREVTTGAPSELFRIPRDAPIEGRISYAPSSDGERFLVNLAAPDRVRQPTFETQVVVNWPSTVSGTR